MFGGYADVAAYNFGESMNDNVTNGLANLGIEPMPIELLPTYSPPRPWRSGAAIQDDFVLVAEFSEQEGPKPLITIPREAGGNFDLNDFAVRIMSVDYQTLGNDNFSMTDDAQVILTESNRGISAYVHHFTLHDSMARGFVRPFCMSYVTTEHSKLMHFYEELSNEFSKVSRYFKYGNLMLFIRDMTHYLADLRYTRERFLDWQQRMENMERAESEQDVALPGDSEWSDQEIIILKQTSQPGLEHLIREVADILDVTSRLLTDKRMEARFQRLEEKCRGESFASNKYSEDSYSLGEKTLPLADARRSPRKHRRSGSFSGGEEGFFPFEEDTSIYQPKIVKTSGRRRFDRSLRTLHELCHWGAKEGLNRLRSVHKYFSRDLAVLEIERKESTLIDPASTLLTIGRNVAVNFLQGVDLHNLSSFEWPMPGRKSHFTNNLLRRWVSDDTLASFKSAESFLSCQEDMSDSPLPSVKSGYEPAFVMGSAYIEERSSISSYEWLTSSLVDENTDDTTEDSVVSGDSTERDSFPAGYLSATESSLELGACLGDTRAEMPLDTEFLYGSQESGSTPDSQDLPQSNRVAVISAADHVDNLGPNSPGYGLLKLLVLYPFSPHILYSLLCGRTVVVVGNPSVEKDVKAAVNTLAFFVPGHSSRCHMVVPSQTKSLRIMDIARIKLVGIIKSEKKPLEHVVPNSVKKYVTVLDIDKRSLWAPPYQGGIITGIVNKRRHFRGEKAYIAYIHSILLDLASKAFIYYHAYCVAGPVDDSLPRSASGSSVHKETRLEFISKLGLSGQDALIVQYFAEIIKVQQTEELYATEDRERELPATTIKINHTRCNNYKIA